MPSDMLLEEQTFPCEYVPEEELREAVLSLYAGYTSESDSLKRGICLVSEDQIPWKRIRSLYVLGTADNASNRALKKAAITSGTYVNWDGSFLLLVHPDTNYLWKTLDLCRLSLHHLSIYHSSVTILLGLEKLTQLISLELSRCDKLTALPGLANLTQLTSLKLYWCKNLTALPGLKNLTQLTTLNLSYCYRLTTLPGLANLTQLISLILFCCDRLTALPGLENLTQLSWLNLERCYGLTELPESIRSLTNMRRLDLSCLKLRELPDWLPEIAEKFSLEPFGAEQGTSKAVVNLYGTTVEGVDMSIFEQPYEMVVDWFKNRAAGTAQPLNEIKVVFLGDGEAGKSHTIARLLNNGGYPDTETFDGESTPGIVISNKEYNLGDRRIQVHYWDFGGQEILHSMHRIFLTGRTMYVILLNARDDTQSDRARYWLHNVKSFAPGAPVLLVLNKIDQNPKASLNEKDLRDRYDKLTRVVRLSAKDFTPEEFNRAFTQALLEEIQNTGFLNEPWPISWKKVKGELERMPSHYITGDQYLDICRECRVDKNQQNLLHWFNDLGISFCFCDENDYALRDYVILRPEWITNALYIFLFNECEGARNGLIPHQTIFRLLTGVGTDPGIRCVLPDAQYRTYDIQYVLGVMRKFSLSFTDGNENEFIPMLCQQDSKVEIKDYREDQNVLEFNMEFDYLPNNLLHRLMVERKQELDMDNVWRTGASFRLPELKLSAVVVIDGNTLRFYIRHGDPMHRPNTYLSMLKANVDRIVKHMGLKAPKCQLVYKIHGKRATFAYDRLLKMRAKGKKEEYCEALDEDFLIGDILNQSAPDGMEEEMRLLDAIQKSCLHIQGDMRYRGSEEDDRNTRIRDDLRMIGYTVHDQTRQGITASGKRAGELDLEIRRDNGYPWAIVEALRINSGAKSNWNTHLEKLVDTYNAHGLPVLFLIAYADCEKEKFDAIWKGYLDTHIPDHSTSNFSVVKDSVDTRGYAQLNLLKTARCRYLCGEQQVTVYHIFVQMDPPPHKKTD